MHAKRALLPFSNALQWQIAEPLAVKHAACLPILLSGCLKAELIQPSE